MTHFMGPSHFCFHPSSDQEELTAGSNNHLPDMNLLSSCKYIWYSLLKGSMFLAPAKPMPSHSSQISLSGTFQAATSNSLDSWTPEPHLQDGYQRQRSSNWDSADKLARPNTGCANSRSVAWGQQTLQWLDGWLVLASEQKEKEPFLVSAVLVSSMASVSGMCVFILPTNYIKFSS